MTDGPDPASIARYIVETFDRLDIVEASGDWFFIYKPRRELKPDRRQPFATIVTSDRHDAASNLDRAGVFRLNIGVGKVTYRTLLGAPPAPRPDFGILDTGHDYTTVDRILPHPVYGAMGWIAVINPSAETFETLKPLLAEAYRLSAGKLDKQAAPDEP